MIVAIAKAITAMPEKPSPPAIDFGRTSATCIFVSVNETILIFNIFVPSIAIFILNG